jgi:hypothetical protein
MKKNLIILLMALLLLPSGLHATSSTSTKSDYCGYNPRFNDWQPTKFCYVVQPGDTLWGIADQYLGSGFLWQELTIYKEPGTKQQELPDPRQLEVGTRIKIQRDQFEVYSGYRYIGDFDFTRQDNTVYTVSRNHGGKAVINQGQQFYDGPFNFVRDLHIDPETGNLLYLVDTEAPNTCKDSYHGFRVVFNKQQNKHFSCGWDYQELIFSPNGELYAVRNNKGDKDAKEQFIVLSNIGNSPYYDYVDSLMWHDNKLIYRAQINDVWRVVINHQGQETYKYVENLKVENGAVNFDVIDENGDWVKKQIQL